MYKLQQQSYEAHSRCLRADCKPTGVYRTNITDTDIHFISAQILFTVEFEPPSQYKVN